MNSDSSNNSRKKSPKQPAKNWRKDRPKESPEESSEESSPKCVMCHNKTCSFKYNCRFLWKGNCKHDRACTCTGTSTLVCEPIAAGGSAVNKQPVPVHDPVPVTQIVSAKVGASSDNLDDAFSEASDDLGYNLYELDNSLAQIQMVMGFDGREDKRNLNLVRKNGRHVIVNESLDLHETFLKINASIKREQLFNTHFNESDIVFLSDPKNNKRIAKFLMNLCHNLNKQIDIGMTLEKCYEIMSPAKYLFASGSSPLHVAAAVGDEELAYFLVKFGFCLDQKNQKGFTPRKMFHEIHDIDCRDIELAAEMSDF
jgi:hypothetical protein